MIRFAMTRAHAYTVKAFRRERAAPRVEVVPYDRLLAARRLARAVYVFTDFDRLGAWDLELAAVVHRRLAEAGVPVLNDPARVKTRYALLRALHEAGINAFNAYRLDECVRPARYPVFLRREAGHGQPLSGLLADWDAVARASEQALADGVPASAVVIVEYAAEPERPGIFRKLALARVGERFVPQVCVHDDNWLVKRGKLGGATPELYEDDLRIVRENPFAGELARAFQIAGIEYGRADFGLVGGRVQVYEINTNPVVSPGGAHPSPQRVESMRSAWAQFVEALHALDDRRLPGGPVRIADARLAPHQGWRGRAVRSRSQP